MGIKSFKKYRASKYIHADGVICVDINKNILAFFLQFGVSVLFYWVASCNIKKGNNDDIYTCVLSNRWEAFTL